MERTNTRAKLFQWHANQPSARTKRPQVARSQPTRKHPEYAANDPRRKRSTRCTRLRFRQIDLFVSNSLDYDRRWFFEFDTQVNGPRAATGCQQQRLIIQIIVREPVAGCVR